VEQFKLTERPHANKPKCRRFTCPISLRAEGTRGRGGRTQKRPGEKVSPGRFGGVFQDRIGGDLLSHPVTQAVPSAQRGLTAVFGMGTGVSPSPLPPKKATTP
jgi:hypothetical protein